MPRAKTNRGGHKTIRCPRCGKRFCSETSVLRHMNQPTGPCYGTTWFQDHTNTPQDYQEDGQFSDGAVPHEATRFQSPSHSQANDDHYPSLPNDDEPEYQMDFDDSGPRKNFTEVYPGCSNSYAGGAMFRDLFWQDEHADERRENLYFPFASAEEWQFASWCSQSGLSMASIDSLLSLSIITRLSLSFQTAKDLRARIESLPSGSPWLCKQIHCDAPTKQPIRLFYRPALDCVQSLLSHPLLAPHMSFVPRKVWTSAARICRIYEDWLSGERAWDIQDSLPAGATVLGVVLSSDKTNISVMSGNRMAYPLLISLANIDPSVRSKISRHTYLLLALLPTPKFVHKDTRTRGLLHDRLIHHSLNIVLEPLKTAARIGIMMNDPAGNVRYCYTPIAAYIADTPELSLVACTSQKASPFTTATSKNFGDGVLHSPRTGASTLIAIRRAREKYSSEDFKAFLKAAKALSLNGVVEPFWADWPLSCPSLFLHPEALHHFHRFSWDHDIKWCIQVVNSLEIDFRFSLLQPTVGYRGFQDGISKLKQVTGRDHRSIQRYIVGVIAGAVPRRFLIAIRALADFRYLAQAPAFSDGSLAELSNALQLFHEHKDAVVQAGVRDSWEIPKLELLQSVVSSIRRSGPVMQWSADPTEHAHVQEIKVPARSSNNQNYYEQIARYLDRSDKCFRFNIATYLEAQDEQIPLPDEDDIDSDREDQANAVESYTPSLFEHMNVSRPIVDYFLIAEALSLGCVPNAPTPYRTFSSSSTAFHVANKPSVHITVDEAATLFGIPDLRPAIWEFLQRLDSHTNHNVSGVRTQDLNCPLPFDRIQVWYKLRVQQVLFHADQRVDAPQTLRAFPPSPDRPHGLYDAAIISPGSDSDWPLRGVEGHIVVQLRLIFRPMNADYFAAYVQRFNIVSQQGNPGSVHQGTGMHLLRRATSSHGRRVGDVVPVSHIRSAAHLIPNFGKEAHSRLNKYNSHEVSTEFWLNKYWSKEFYYALCPL